jgi:hypothetical protein
LTPAATTPQSTPTPSPPTPSATVASTPAPTPTDTPTPAASSGDELIISSIGVDVPLDTSCGDPMDVPEGSQVCYWDLTGGGGGFYSFAGATTGPLAALSTAAAGATMTWTVEGTSHTRLLSGTSQTFPLGNGHDVPPGQPAYLQLRTSMTVTEYDAES